MSPASIPVIMWAASTAHSTLITRKSTPPSSMIGYKLNQNIPFVRVHYQYSYDRLMASQIVVWLAQCLTIKKMIRCKNKMSNYVLCSTTNESIKSTVGASTRESDTRVIDNTQHFVDVTYIRKVYRHKFLNVTFFNKMEMGKVYRCWKFLNESLLYMCFSGTHVIIVFLIKTESLIG